MGIKNYGVEVDMWSVGCIILELLSRKITFQAVTIPSQLKMMTSLLGRPKYGQLSGCDGAKEFMLSQPKSAENLMTLIEISEAPQNDHLAAYHLVKNLLTWNRHERYTTHEALMSRFVSDGRMRFHSCMCSCCNTIEEKRNFCQELEPVPRQVFNDSYESSLPSIQFAKGYYLRKPQFQYLGG
jgi:nemo like kinase